MWIRIINKNINALQGISAIQYHLSLIPVFCPKAINGFYFIFIFIFNHILKAVANEGCGYLFITQKNSLNIFLSIP